MAEKALLNYQVIFFFQFRDFGTARLLIVVKYAGSGGMPGVSLTNPFFKYRNPADARRLQRIEEWKIREIAHCH